MASDPSASVTVVGSLNVDYIAKVGRLPAPGETVSAQNLETVFGGKGANQAIAAARQGAAVSLIGSVGRDEMGRAYLEHLAVEEIESGRILETPMAATGSAFISVDDEGENMIVVAPGANELTAPEHVRAVDQGISESSVLLAQFEVPLAAVVEAIRIANRAEVVSIVNPSPIRQTFPWREVMVDYLIVNEREAAELLGFVPRKLHDAGSMLPVLGEMNVRSLIITRGSESTIVISRKEAFEVSTLPVLPVDTVGAGDAFAGCFAARMALGESIQDAVRAANCAGALTTLGSGAQTPIPNRGQVDQHRDRLSS